MAQDSDNILITEKDLLRIRTVMASNGKTDWLANLDLELERAKIITDSEVPRDLVTMNSKVRYLVKNENREATVTLVYPKDANIDEQKISVLAPLGSALIGLRVGQSINWQIHEGNTKIIEILEVIYQPEESGDWHL